MPLGAGCPRCPAPVVEDEQGWRCRDHGPITPLWRPVEADYESFAEHVTRAGTMPTYVPWPLAPGWTVTDFGCVARPGSDGRATVLSTSGPSDADGVVEVSVVAEEAGVGLGSRCAGLSRSDPGAEIGDGPPHVRLRILGRPVSLWSVLTSEADVAFDRSVFAGEAEGRWLWLVLWPASAALLLRDEWILMDVADLGPALVDVPFGGHPPPW
jgi:hypothetical protein